MLGFLIKNARISQGISQGDLCQYICTPSYLSKIENETVVCDQEMARELVSQDNMCEKMALLFRALSEPIRVKLVLSMLHGEVCVQGFVELLELSQPSISNQLARLKRDGIVKSRKEKNNIYYSLDDDHVHDLVEIGLKHIEHI